MSHDEAPTTPGEVLGRAIAEAAAHAVLDDPDADLCVRPATTPEQVVGEAAVLLWMRDPYDDRNATDVVLTGIRDAGGVVVLPDSAYVALPRTLVERAVAACRAGASSAVARELEQHLAGAA